MSSDKDSSSSDGLPLPGVASTSTASHSDRDIPGSGPFWFFTWFCLNISVTVMNKAFFSFWSFPYPAALSAVHMAFTSVLSFLAYPGDSAAATRREISARGDHYAMLRLSLLFTANIFVGNLCLLYASVSLVQTIRSVIPGITVFLSMLFLQKRYQFRHFQSVFLVVIGVALAAGGEFTSESVSLTGIGLTVLVCFLSSLKSVFSAKYLTTLHFHPMQLLSKMAAYACVQMLILSWWTGEFDAILITYEQQSNSMLFFMILFSNGVMAFMLNLANFATTKKTSALTVTVGGNLKHMATIIISIIIFQNPISLLNGIGIALAAIGAAVYSYVEYTDKINSRINPTHDNHKGSLLAVNIDAKEARS